MPRTIFVFIFTSVAFFGLSEESMTERDKFEFMSQDKVFSTIYENPAMKQFQRPYSFSLAGIGMENSKNRSNRPCIPAEGTGDTEVSFQAESYLKHNGSTLWGAAGYTTGKTENIKWCETSDYDIVYPYILGDMTGGDMKKELYRFGGGISSSSGRYIYGASISYDAGLYYRNIDPRPRNITGLLKLGIGAGLTTGKYALAAHLKADKYKQTNSVVFISELGVDKLYHLTGLGTDYTRFAGTGSSTYYTGWRYGGSIDIHPSDKNGLAGLVSLTHFSFDNIISDLNKLPMASVKETEYHAEAGWKADRFCINGILNIIRRLGNENIFGDATSGSYPQIATLTQYARNNINTGATVSANTGTRDKWEFSGEFTGFYCHDNRVQSSANARSIINSLNLTAIAGALFQPTDRLLFTAKATFGKKFILDDTSTPPTEGIEEIIIAATEEFKACSYSNLLTGIDLSATVAQSPKLAFKITFRAVRTSLRNECSLGASVIF